MKIDNKAIVVVTPVYEDAHASRQLFQELALTHGSQVFALVIDDGSLLHPVGENVIREAGLTGTVLRLSRNVGHQKAIAIGLNYLASHLQGNEIVVIMDSDGEDTPVSIKDLLLPLESGDVDIVVAQRKNRVETVKFKIFYFLYKMIFQDPPAKSL